MSAKQSKSGYMKAYYAANKDKWKRTREQQAAHNAARRAKYAADEAFRQACKDQAMKHKRKNPGMRRASDLKRMYGITHDEYLAFLESQQNKCAICSEDFVQTPSVDHCHVSGVVRGLLCEACNFGIGKFNDDPDTMRKAIVYLERQKKVGVSHVGA